MKFSALSALFVAGAAAQSLTDVLGQHQSVSALVGLLQTQPDLVSALSSAKNITILAPSNEAIAALTADPASTAAIAADSGLIAAILSYHVINGTFRGDSFSNTPKFLPSLLTNATYANVTGGQNVEGKTVGQTVQFKSGLQKTSNVTQANVDFDGGVIHIINSVLTLPPKPAAALTAFSLSSLAESLTKANLVQTVTDLKDVTIFAPNNAAFEAIASTAANLTMEQLSSVLTYHVVQGAVAFSSGLKDGQKVKTVNGQELTVSVKDGEVKVGNAKVVIPDVLLSNGVVHVIDSVLLPSSDSGSGSGSGSGTGSSPNPTTSSPPASAGNLLALPGVASLAALMAGAFMLTAM